MSRPGAQSPTTTTTITIGTRLTDFSGVDLTVTGLSTAGGMGLVVWGQNAAKGNNFMEALKLLKPERVALAAARGSQARQAVERQFEDEALVWCHLWPHQCVIETYGLTRLKALDDLPVLELEYAPNGSLRDLLVAARQQHGFPPLRTALAWAVHITSALAHIHQPDPDHDRPAPLIHCDLKPENVLLSEHGWAQLTDLGLTRAYAALDREVAGRTAGAQAGASAAGPSAGDDTSPLSAHKAEVARLRAVLQAAGMLEGPGDPDTTTLLATHTVAIPPTRGGLEAIAGQDRGSPGGSREKMLSAAAHGGRQPGLAQVLAIGGRSGGVAGTPPYMAPEQWQGLDATVPATDIYALGVLLYELFAGSAAPHPFPHDPLLALRQQPALSPYAQASGYDMGLLAWHAAHLSGPVHRLTDEDVAAAALTSGPLTELTRQRETSRREAAAAALRQLDALVVACLAPEAAARPTAAEVQHRLLALALDTCGLESMPIPEPIEHTRQNEGVFWTCLGTVYDKLGRYEEAVAALRRAVSDAADPSNAVNWNNLGSALLGLGEEEQQQAAYAESARGRDVEAAALRARAHQHLEEALVAVGQAEAHLTAEVVARSPGLPASLALNRGAVLSTLGRYAEAVAANQQALALRPDKHDARFNLALDYARWSQEAGATDAERVARLRSAQREIERVVAAAPSYTRARSLEEMIARALADPGYRFVG